MFQKDEIKRLEQKIDELTESLRKVSERQNSQYTDIMLQLRSGVIVNEYSVNDDIEVQYGKAYDVIAEFETASTSLLQRMLRVGYLRADELMVMLEQRGVVGPAEGSKPRKVYIKENND